MGDAPITQRAMGSPSRFGGRAVSIRAIRASQGRGPTGVNMEVGHSQIAGGSDQPVRGVMLTQAPHRDVRRSITPGGVTVRLTHRPPQPNPSTKKKKEPAFSSSFGSGCPHGDALR